MDKQQIEQLLQQSARPAQQLTPAEKQVLFSRVQEAAQKKRPLWSVFEWPVIVASAGVAAVVILTVFLTDDITFDTQVIAWRSANGGAQVNSNSNTNTSANTNQSEDFQVAFGPRTHRQNIERYVYGTGGAPSVHRWTVLTEQTFLQEKATIREQFVYRINENRMREIVGVFGTIPALYSLSSEDDTIGLSTLSEGNGTQVCIEYHFTHTLSERCVYVNSRGVVNMQQPVSLAQANGKAEALQYVAALTGLTASHWTVVEVQSEAPITATESWTQYQIYPNENSFGALPYMTPGWHFAIENGKLVSFTGSMLSIQADVAAKTYVTVSEQEAYERMQKDFTLNPETDDIGQVESTVGYYTDPFTVVELSSHQDLSLTVLEGALEYELFEDRKNLESGKHTLRLLPVYRMRGVQTGTENTFEVLIDATQERLIAENYRLIDHPAQLF